MNNKIKKVIKNAFQVFFGKLCLLSPPPPPPPDMFINYLLQRLKASFELFTNLLFLIFRLITQEAHIQNYRLNDWRVHASHCIHDYNYKALKVIFQTLVFLVKLYFSRNFEESKMNIVRLTPMRL